MLEQKDLQAIAMLLETQITASEKRMIEEMDRRIEKSIRASEKRMIEEMDRRIERAIRASEKRMIEEMDRRIERAIRASEKRMIEEMDRRIEEAIRASENRMIGRMKQMEFRLMRDMKKCIGQSIAYAINKSEERIIKSEELMLDEMERYDRKNERRFQEMSKRIEACEDIYRVVNTEKEAVTELLTSIDQIEGRLAVIEKRLEAA